jgi:hypothetical protein
MFETLDDQIKQDNDAANTKTERMLRWVLVLVISLLVFGGLYLGVRSLG